MTERKVHPDFLATPEEYRWNGTLPKLAEYLKHAAYKAQGEEVWVVLPGGALVAMRIDEKDFRKHLRIARRLSKPFSEKSSAAWATERAVFLGQLGCKEWDCVSGALYTPPDLATKRPAKIEAVYVEPAALGAPPTEVECARCHKKFTPGPKDRVYRELICNACAVELGQEETRALQTKRETAGGPKT